MAQEAGVDISEPASRCLMLLPERPRGADIFECRTKCEQCGFFVRHWDLYKAEENTISDDGRCEHNAFGIVPPPENRVDKIRERLGLVP